MRDLDLLKAKSKRVDPIIYNLMKPFILYQKKNERLFKTQ